MTNSLHFWYILHCKIHHILCIFGNPKDPVHKKTVKYRIKMNDVFSLVRQYSTDKEALFWDNEDISYSSKLKFLQKLSHWQFCHKMSYTPPPLDLSYEANGTIYSNSELENTVFKFSNIFLDHLIPGNLLPQDILERIIEDPDSIEDIFLGKFLSWFTKQFQLNK